MRSGQIPDVSKAESRVYTLDVMCEKREIRVEGLGWDLEAGLVTEMEDGGSNSP